MQMYASKFKRLTSFCYFRFLNLVIWKYVGIIYKVRKKGTSLCSSIITVSIANFKEACIYDENLCISIFLLNNVIDLSKSKKIYFNIYKTL